MITGSEPGPTTDSSDSGDGVEDSLRVVVPAPERSERERLKQELQEVAERYRLFVGNSTEGIARIELREPIATSIDVEQQVELFYEHGFLAEANSALVKMYHLPAVELIIGIGFEVIFPRGDAGAQDDIRNFIREGYVIRKKRSDNLDPQGVRTSTEWDVTGIVRDGFVREIWFRIRDITEQQRLEDELEQARRMDAVGVLAAGLAHDFNNLLTAITLNLGAAEVADGDAAAPLMATAKNALENAAQLAQQMLSIGSRTDAIRYTIQLRPEVDNIVELLRRGIDANVTVTLDMADDLYLMASPIQSQHIILNLLSNAADAMPQGGQIVVRASAPAGEMPLGLRTRELGYVMIEVEDDGSGMSSETVARIFEPYFSTKPRSGHGLGLSVVYGIVQEHHGMITVTSEPGAGTTFTLWIPASSLEDGETSLWGQTLGDRTTDSATRFTEALAVREPTPPVVAASAAPVVGGSILVVDDREDLRDICRLVLETAGFTVNEAEDGADALRMLNAGTLPGVVLIDVTMPGMSGPDAVATIRDRFPGVTPVLMTGYSTESIGEMLRAESVRLLRKPFSNAELVDTVSAALGE